MPSGSGILRGFSENNLAKQSKGVDSGFHKDILAPQITAMSHFGGHGTDHSLDGADNQPCMR